MLIRQLGSVLATVAGIYAALLTTYFANCLVVTRLNRGAVKIQPSRQTPQSQIRRDRNQSLFSLAVIATMLGCGHWAYTTLGWGLHPVPGIGGGVLSLIESLLLFDTWFCWFHGLIHI